jgi:hypothetical protein
MPTVSKARLAGYSGKPLSEKLGYKPATIAAFLALPEALAGLPKSTPFARVTHAMDWTEPLPAGAFDLIHAFTANRSEIALHLAALQAALKPDGVIWVSWPKKAAKMPTDVTEDVIRAEALKLDLVDVKVAAVDALWSGLKLVIRKERRMPDVRGQMTEDREER